MQSHLRRIAFSSQMLLEKRKVIRIWLVMKYQLEIREGAHVRMVQEGICEYETV